MNTVTPSSTRPPAAASTAELRPQTTAPSNSAYFAFSGFFAFSCTYDMAKSGNLHLDRKELDLAVDAFTNFARGRRKKDSRLIAENLKGHNAFSLFT